MAKKQLNWLLSGREHILWRKTMWQKYHTIFDLVNSTCRNLYQAFSIRFPGNRLWDRIVRISIVGQCYLGDAPLWKWGQQDWAGGGDLQCGYTKASASMRSSGGWGAGFRRPCWCSQLRQSSSSPPSLLRHWLVVASQGSCGLNSPNVLTELQGDMADITDGNL